MPEAKPSKRPEPSSQTGRWFSPGIATLIIAAILLFLVSWLPASYIAQRGSAILETVLVASLALLAWTIVHALSRR